jgi:hypothetical protein
VATFSEENIPSRCRSLSELSSCSSDYYKPAVQQGTSKGRPVSVSQVGVISSTPKDKKPKKSITKVGCKFFKKWFGMSSSKV